METGKKFDSNVDTSFGHAEPISLVIGSGQTIRGWEEGLQLFGKGGKGTLYIPSLMGYGPPGKPPVIPAYAPLVFDVEVKDVSAAPPPQPQMNMQMPNQPNQAPGN